MVQPTPASAGREPGSALLPGSPSPSARAALLLAGSPREILARIVPGDPLGLRPRLAAVLRERAVLLDADRAFLRTVAGCAREAPAWRGRPPLEDWLADRAHRAVDELLLEESEPRFEDGAPRADVSSVFSLLAGPLGLDPAALARGCRAFHRLPEADREAFFLLVLERRSLAETASALGLSPPVSARAARRALDVFLHASPPESTASTET